MGYLLTSATGKTMLIKHFELKEAYELAGLGEPGPGYVGASAALRLAEAVRRQLPELDDVTPEMAAEGDPGGDRDDLDKPRSYRIDAVPPRTRLDAEIMREFMEMANEGAFEVSRLPEA